MTAKAGCPVAAAGSAGDHRCRGVSHRWNQSVVSWVIRLVSWFPPSWPPANHTMSTGAPLRRMAWSLALAWSRPNRESSSPWISSVGTSIRLATLDGLDRSSREIACGVARPSVATRWYMAHRTGRKRPQSAAGTPVARAVPGDRAGVPDPAAVPRVKSSPAHCLLNTPFTGTPFAGMPFAGTPFAGPPLAASGNSALARLYHVACGTIASIRWS